MSSPQHPYHSQKSGNPVKYTFPKKEKLTHKKHFELLFREGKTVCTFPIKLFYFPIPFRDNAPIKVAVTAPKRKFKRAVHRNRIKRLLRETYRLNKHLVFDNIPHSFAFLFLYLGDEIPTYKVMNMAMQELLHAFLKKEAHEKTD